MCDLLIMPYIIQRVKHADSDDSLIDLGLATKALRTCRPLLLRHAQCKEGAIEIDDVAISSPLLLTTGLFWRVLICQKGWR